MKDQNKIVQLVVLDGYLYTKREDIVDQLQAEWYRDLRDGEWYKSPEMAPYRDVIGLFYEWPGGDHDSVKWPLQDPKFLAGALFDAREMGVIPDVRTVLLPDGSEFQIDRHVE